MKYALIFLVAFVCVLHATNAIPSKVCEPGEVTKKDCNECKCNEDGTDMACTRKMCSGSEDGAEPASESKGEQTDEANRCTPGEIFKRDCNNCTCPASGIKSDGACTLLACFDDGVQN